MLPPLLPSAFLLADRRRKSGLVYRWVRWRCGYELETKHCYRKVPLEVALKDSDEERSCRGQISKHSLWTPTL